MTTTYVLHHRYSPPAGDIFQVHQDGTVTIEVTREGYQRLDGVWVPWTSEFVALAEKNAATYRAAVADGSAQVQS